MKRLLLVLLLVACADCFPATAPQIYRRLFTFNYTVNANGEVYEMSCLDVAEFYEIPQAEFAFFHENDGTLEMIICTDLSDKSTWHVVATATGDAYPVSVTLETEF